MGSGSVSLDVPLGERPKSSVPATSAPRPKGRRGKLTLYRHHEPERVSQTEPLIRNVSDTALWSAVYRAAESERPDALFRDPYARRLAAERGRQIAESVPGAVRADWAWVGRTYLFDQLIVEQLGQGVDMVVNLAAGLDARPYRMDLPPTLQWVEVDLPGILDYKEEILAGERPVCALERVRLGLA